VALHVIIDGYNFIRQSDDLRELDRQALEFGRDALIEKLAAYKRIKRHKITLVFDGSSRYFFPDATTSWKGVGIKFSRHGETADALIKKMVLREREKSMVVTSDRELLNFVGAQGASIIESGEFGEKLLLAESMESQSPVEDNGLPSGIKGTKKKGPARKLPRNQRKNIRRINKL
jgi:uncharacterized protein